MSPLQSLAQLTTTQIVDCFVLGTAIAALAGLGTVVMGRKSSGVRFLIWFVALIATASLFFFSGFLGHGTAARVGKHEIVLGPEWAIYIFGAWAFCATIGLARVARGLWRLRLLKRNCVPLDAAKAGLFEAEMWMGQRRFTLCTSQQVRVPAALGFFRPVIVLPAWVIGELSSEELRTIVLHESAHLQRWDDWTNLLQKVLRALLFFHPAVWWIESRLSIEREMSCDDMVLVRSRSPRQYAACLVSLAEKTHSHRSLALAQAAVSHLQNMAQRISKILDGRERTATPFLKPAAAAVAVFAAISFMAVQHTPQLVGFDNPAQGFTASAEHFDYVANSNPLTARALAVSLRLSGTGAPAPLRARLAAQKQSLKQAPRKVTRRPLAPQVEEARDFGAKRTPAMVNAAMTDEGVPSFVYLVTQTEQYDEFGNVAITTSVWRIRVMKPAPVQASSPVLPHQT